MKQSNPQESRLWAYINRTHITEKNIKELEHFKSNMINHKLSIWNPKTNGIRFLKELIFFICSNLAPSEWEKLRKIPNREVGTPYSIQYNDETVCLDYLQAVFEICFIEKYFNFRNSTVIEIGAGYGRTCHAILTNYDVKAYFIVDLKNSLKLSMSYLKAVLDEEQYDKIAFVSTNQFNDIKKQNYDLCVNIDSFAEMDEETVYLYLNFIDRQCTDFYVKNPVGKYFDKDLDSQSEGNSVVEMALETGILRDIINIYNNSQVEQQSEKYVKSYCPSRNWYCVSNGWAKPWSFYWQAFYKKR